MVSFPWFNSEFSRFNDLPIGEIPEELEFEREHKISFLSNKMKIGSVSLFSDMIKYEPNLTQV